MSKKTELLSKVPRQILGLPKGCMMDGKGNKVFPETEGEAADLLYKVREARYALQRLVTAHDEYETFIENHFIETLPAKKSSGVSGVVAHVQVETKPTPQVKNWKKFYEYVTRHKAFELLQKRISTASVQERIDHGQADKMGVVIFNAKKVSCTKI